VQWRVMGSSDPRDINHPFFVRFYRRSRRSAVTRGENEHRRRVLEGLSGVVVELGAGDGANFALYPETVTEVIAIEPEPRFRAQATDVARTARLRAGTGRLGLCVGARQYSTVSTGSRKWMCGSPTTPARSIASRRLGSSRNARPSA
jgi:hypothetical protein